MLFLAAAVAAGCRKADDAEALRLPTERDFYDLALGVTLPATPAEVLGPAGKVADVTLYPPSRMALVRVTPAAIGLNGEDVATLEGGRTRDADRREVGGRAIVGPLFDRLDALRADARKQSLRSPGLAVVPQTLALMIDTRVPLRTVAEITATARAVYDDRLYLVLRAEESGHKVGVIRMTADMLRVGETFAATREDVAAPASASPAPVASPSAP